MSFTRVQLVTTGRGERIGDCDLEMTMYGIGESPVVRHRPVKGDFEIDKDSYIVRIATGLGAAPDRILRLLAQGAVYLVSDEMVIPSGLARIEKTLA